MQEESSFPFQIQNNTVKFPRESFWPLKSFEPQGEKKPHHVALI